MILSSLLFVACESEQKTVETRNLTPSDFIAGSEGSTASSDSATTTQPTAGKGKDDQPIQADTTNVFTQDTEDPELIKKKNQLIAKGDQAFTVDGMVGHISGKPIFAEDVFNKIGPQTFIRLGKEAPGEFYQTARNLIDQHIEAELFETLLLYEASRTLNEQKLAGLKLMLQSEREKLVNKYGAGSINIANNTLQQKKGRTIDEELQFIRERIIIGELINNRVRSKIQVSKQDAIRYYRKHADKFNTKASVIYLQYTNNPFNGQRFARDLKRDKSDDTATQKFMKASKKNNLEPKEYTYEGELASFDGSQSEAVNTAVRGLKKGETSDKIKMENGQVAWVHIVNIVEGKQVSFTDAYDDIVRSLNNQLYDFYYDKLRESLKADGTFTNPQAMKTKLLEIAIAKFSTR